MRIPRTDLLIVMMLARFMPGPVFPEAGALPGGGARKVLLIGIDGCRPELLESVRPPHLTRLRSSSAYSGAVRILPDRPVSSDTVSGPSWASILTGVWSDKHGILDNKFEGSRLESYPHFFRHLKRHRPEALTASYECWGPISRKIADGADINRLTREGDESYEDGDRRVAKLAVDLLGSGDPVVMFVYFGQVDETGHATGFSLENEPYRHALEVVDGHVGELVAALARRPRYLSEDWLLLLTTDHGGTGFHHKRGHHDPAVNRSFLIARGHGFRPGELSGTPGLVDIVPTALHHLEIPVDPAWRLDGRALQQRADR